MWFSAALCRGLIEARCRENSRRYALAGFPRLYAAASLKPVVLGGGRVDGMAVFRGFMPRPH